MHSQNVKHTTQKAVRQSLVHPTTTGTHQQACTPTRHTTPSTQQQKIKCIGTLSSSQTTPAHPNQPAQRRSVQSDLRLIVRDCFPARHTNQRTKLLSSGALSVSLTGIKLHTPKHKHKPAVHDRFLSIFKYSFWVHYPAEIRSKERNTNKQQDPCRNHGNRHLGAQ